MNIRRLAFLLLLPFLLACKEPENNLNLPLPPPGGSDDPTEQPQDPSENPSENPEQPSTPTEEEETFTPPPPGFIIVGYAYDTDGPMPDPRYLTHINFAFAKINDDYETLYLRSSKEERLKKIVALKQDHPDLKVLLSIGGDGAGNFSEMAADQTHRKNFCQNCLKAVNQYGLDGIDIDWEFPTQTAHGRITGTPEDTQNFTYLMRDLREALGNDKLLTVATEDGAHYMDFPSIIQYLDFVNIMSYCMGCPPYNHNSALGTYNKDRMSCEKSVAKHKEAGVPYEKMVLGMAFFGTAADYDEIDFRDINYDGYNVCWDQAAKVPYLTDSSGTMVLSYDDERSIGLKADFVREKGLLGAMYWALEADDDTWSLSKAIASRLKYGYTPDDPVQATNTYVDNFLKEVVYTDTDYKTTRITDYPGGGPGTADLPPVHTIQWTVSSSAGPLSLRVSEGDWTGVYTLSAGTTRKDLTNLVPKRNYTYQVVATNSGKVVSRGSFRTTGHLRQVYFEPNVRNARDLGGWKGLDGKTVAYHKLFRSGHMDFKDHLNEKGRAEMLAEGIRAELDLRETKYVDAVSSLGSDYDIFGPGFDSGYNEMVERNQPKVKECFQYVVQCLRENKPVIFHCFSGRDRTGTMAVLLLGTLGVSESDMAKDYELTYFAPEYWSMQTEKDEAGNVIRTYFNTTRCNYSYPSVRSTIFKLTDSGTYQERIVKYLRNIGVPQQDIDDLRRIMLE